MVNKIDLLSDSEFIELVNNSSCISDVLKKLGYSTNGNLGKPNSKRKNDKIKSYFYKEKF